MNKYVKIFLKILGVLLLGVVFGLLFVYLLLEMQGFGLVKEKYGAKLMPEEQFEASGADLPLVADTTVKNVILFIGDGMGINQVELTRYRYYGPTGKLNMERVPVAGLVQTKPAGDSLITDSAAGATAIATGYKTDNRMIAMTPDSVVRLTILEALQKRGWMTGLVTTSSITDASPAAFASHVPARDMMIEIAVQMLDHRVNFMAGATGGFEGIYPLQKKSVEKMATQVGYDVVRKKEQLATANDTLVLALFENLATDVREEEVNFLTTEPTLKELTEAAITRLDKKEGFFLMVEQEGTDNGGHVNDADYLTAHLKQMDDAIAAALAFAEQDGQTLVIISADHETGGLTFSQGNMLDGVSVNWSTTGHTGQPVPLFAYGPHAAKFGGKIDNTEIPRILGEILWLVEFQEIEN
ncbi:MAG: alkaline phosphatase [Cyclobacteriaceae bacterium]